METSISALEMRKKFGGFLDRVTKGGEHITIERDGRPLATLIPAREHEALCHPKEKWQTVQEALQILEDWRKRHPAKLRKMKAADTTGAIRKMRDGRWSS
jgi:prevent-host-death family protein